VVWIAGSIALVMQPAGRSTLPDAALAGFDGSSASLQRFAGKPTVVNLWATWCPPCRREMPVLEKAQADHPDLNIVFVNQGESAGTVQGFLQAMGLDLDNVMLDPKGATGIHFEQRALPMTLFFDASGTLVSSRIGELSHATLQERIDELQQRTPSAAQP